MTAEIGHYDNGHENPTQIPEKLNASGIPCRCLDLLASDADNCNTDADNQSLPMIILLYFLLEFIHILDGKTPFFGFNT